MSISLEEKGCVYFFKHVGLSPIKIGFSTNESPYSRFEQFKTYAPYGAELIGFIRTHDAKGLETELHSKFSNIRLKGEWFELSIEEANKCIKFYSSLEDIEEENNFRVAWAKYLNKDSKSKNFELLFSTIEVKGIEPQVLTQTEIANITNTTKSEVAAYFREIDVKAKTYRIKDLIKYGVKIWIY